MQVNLPQQAPQQSSPSAPGGVRIADNFVIERVMLDIDGNEIDPRTKRVIRPNTDKK